MMDDVYVIWKICKERSGKIPDEVTQEFQGRYLGTQVVLLFYNVFLGGYGWLVSPESFMMDFDI